jgi:hypothetical protein
VLTLINADPAASASMPYQVYRYIEVALPPERTSSGTLVPGNGPGVEIPWQPRQLVCIEISKPFALPK